jgi:hypothetical protein
MEVMRIYLLVPLQTSDPIWMFSVRSEAVQVIAPSESEARLRASLRYSRRRMGAVAPKDPWLDPRWVYAHTVQSTDASMPVIAWEPVPQARPVEAAPAALVRPEEPSEKSSRR